MSPKKFQSIRSMFHLSSADCIPKRQPGHDPWYKIRQFYGTMNNYFQLLCSCLIKIYQFTSQWLEWKTVVDHSFSTTVNKKKTCSLWDKEILVVWQSWPLRLALRVSYWKRILAYDSGRGFTKNIVIHLMTVRWLLDKWYHLYTNNFYIKLLLIYYFPKKTLQVVKYKFLKARCFGTLYQ